MEETCQENPLPPQVARKRDDEALTRGDITLIFLGLWGIQAVTGVIRSASLTNFADVARSVGLDPSRLLIEFELPQRWSFGSRAQGSDRRGSPASSRRRRSEAA
jgi:hypothetical protein